MKKQIPNPEFMLNSEQFSYLMDVFVLATHPDKRYIFYKVDLDTTCLDHHGREFSRDAEVLQDFERKLLAERKGDCPKLLVKLSMKSQRRRGCRHAAALCIDFDKSAIEFRNSNGDPVPDVVLSSLRKTLPEYQVQDRCAQEQSDLSSCTFFAFKNLRDMAAGIKDIRDVNIQVLREEIQTHLRDIWWPPYVEFHNNKRKDFLKRAQTEPNLIQVLEEEPSGLTKVLYGGFPFRLDLRKYHADQLPSGPHDAFFVEATAE
ncbi:MAG: hypothetical protein H6861_06180 [Rhodospirillales bacterium]|nr:hypothetical protein [Rhodospirillales bacterium]